MHDAFVTEKIRTQLCTDSGGDGEDLTLDFEQFMVGIDKVV